MRFAVVIPVGPDRDENLAAVMRCLSRQTRPADIVVVVFDGRHFTTKPGVTLTLPDCPLFTFSIEKHVPGMEQPRNVGTRLAIEEMPDLTHVAFLDSDVVVADDWLELIEDALELGEPEARILVAPYDWLGPELRPEANPAFFTTAALTHNDPRWAMFRQHGPDHVYRGDLSAGLACFSGNLVWPIEEFMRVGGFWAEIHHGRCEDGELGLRAVAMDVPISLCAAARGWHLHHPVNTALAIERNRRDVPMLNDRHPWVEGHQVFMVDRDGKAFDVLCSRCHRMVPTNGWWEHAPRCGVNTALTA